ncbi:hypothetical protein C8F04DRAFT_118501 [Mycena alexandri]|uniref:Uncharacterized protein n=1 Tax=Mycena alexandri TaxID=1745969 RepID=A0AAD6SFK6_9AGAR|nr:hypothetical protein C8F04DRAFT_118501 [Mycena alexandri]
MSEQWCVDECLQCARVFDGQATYCSAQCQLDAAPPIDDSDDESDDSPTYSSWDRVSRWAQAVDPTPPPSPPIYLSPSKRILTPQYPTACIITSDSDVTSKPRASPPRPTRTSPTATESLVATSPTTSPLSLSGLVRSWAPHTSRPQLPRLTTANFTVFAKTHPPPPPQLLPSDESTSDGDVSPVWWVSHDPATTSSSPQSQRFVIQRHAPASRGRKLARAVA